MAYLVMLIFQARLGSSAKVVAPAFYLWREPFGTAKQSASRDAHADLTPSSAQGLGGPRPLWAVTGGAFMREPLAQLRSFFRV